jgi:hypothetical protein
MNWQTIMRANSTLMPKLSMWRLVNQSHKDGSFSQQLPVPCEYFEQTLISRN